MLLGVKSYDNKKFFEHFKDSADFFEVQAIQNKDYSFLKDFSLPFVVHAEHMGFKKNIADSSIEKENIESINFAIKIADLVNSKKIILHPGKILNKFCTESQSLKILEKFDDNRIILENLPNKNNGLCDTPKNTLDFLNKSNKRLILDINHAIQTAIKNKVDYLSYLDDFIKIKPAHYHFGGQTIHTNDNNTHLSFKDSNIDHKKIIKLLPNSAEITLEVTSDIKKCEYDLNYIRNIIKKI